ncbi:MAG: DUF6580 family putative transport protein [bacterium]
MPSHSSSLFSRSTLLACVLLLSGIFFRVLRVDLAPEVLPNFSPLMAAALCGALFLPGFMGLVIPLVALLISDALLNLHYGEPLVSKQLLWTLPCYLFAIGIGWMLRGRRIACLPALAGTLVASLIFYIVTNTGCWMGQSAYPQDWAGWIQALTVGLPGYPPTWSFLRNSLIGDLLFTAVFVMLEQQSPAMQRNSVAVS